MLYNVNEIRKLWLSIYDENPLEFHSRFTKAYEIVAVTSAILTGLGAVFVSQENSAMTSLVAPLAVLFSIISFNTSVIMVLMINSVRVCDIREFLGRWMGVAAIPTVGVILSCLLVLGAMCIHLKPRVSVVLAPIATVAALWNVRFYFNIRKYVISLTSELPVII